MPCEINPPAIPKDTEKAPVQNAFAGLYFGIIVAPMMVIVGAMLCLTGLGIFVGVPMIIGGILAPLIGPLIGFGAMRGKCPSCGAPVSSLPSAQTFDCDACHHRIAVRDHKFVAVA
jgi:DNA-directed RNA polymerase subunit RPC12/RpoP